jgi:3-oxoacyl-[acyl-carrier-protein] synthase-3
LCWLGSHHRSGLGLDRLGTGDQRVAGELLSDITDPKDLATAILFSDGAGAAVMTVSETPGIAPVVWGSDGGKWDVINMTLSRAESRMTGRPDLIEQEGPSVFRWATATVPLAAKQALEAANVGVEDLAAFIPHQANLRIIDMVAKRLALPEHVIVSNDVVTSGNASAGTIPIAIDHLLAEHPELSGKLALQMGFGAGLTWAGQVIVLP